MRIFENFRQYERLVIRRLFLSHIGTNISLQTLIFECLTGYREPEQSLNRRNKMQTLSRLLYGSAVVLITGLFVFCDIRIAPIQSHFGGREKYITWS